VQLAQLVAGRLVPDRVTPRATSNARKRVTRFKNSKPASVVMHLSA
jgi:hypothetical protein